MKKLMRYKVNKGYIFSLTRKNTCAMLFWSVVILALYIWYMSSGLVYFCNAFSSGYNLNTAKFISNAETPKIERTDDYFPTSEYSEILPPMLQLGELYRDGLAYRYKIPVDSYEEVGLAYTIGEDSCLRAVRYNPQTGNIPSDAVQKVAIVTVAGKQMTALMPPDEKINAGDAVPYACLSVLSRYVYHDLGMTDAAGKTVLSYSLDLRYLIVDDEINDFALVIVFSILFPLFFLFTLFLFIKPQFHPNYLRINKFGDVNDICREIDGEIRAESTYKEGRSIYTEHYIIYQSLHATKVQKNHMLRN